MAAERPQAVHVRNAFAERGKAHRPVSEANKR